MKRKGVCVSGGDAEAKAKTRVEANKSESVSRFTLAWVACRLLGLPDGASAAEREAAAAENVSARANIGRVRLLLERLSGAEPGARAVDGADVTRLFARNARGGYDVEEWIERGALPGGGADPRYEITASTSRKNLYSALLLLADPERQCAEMARRQRPAGKGVSAASGAQVAAAARRFRARSNQLAEEVRVTGRRNELSERERRSILPWGSIMARYAERRRALKPDDKLIVDFWLTDPVEFPPKRLDFGDCVVVPELDPHDTTARLNRVDGNYLRVRPARSKGARDFAELHLRDYKTARHYREFVQVLPPSLATRVVRNLDAEAEAEIEAEMRARGEELGPDRPSSAQVRARWRAYLFQARHGAPGPVADNTFGRQVSTAFRRLTGVPIGASNLRKSFITHLLAQPDVSQARLAEVARRMLHSEEMQRGYRRVDIAKSDRGDRPRADRGDRPRADRRPQTRADPPANPKSLKPARKIPVSPAKR
jgi:hypothetical protein